MLPNKDTQFTIYGDCKGISDHIRGRVYDLTTEDGWISLIECLENQEKRIKELERFKLSIISFAECNENINRRTLNDLIELIDYDRE